MHQKRKKRESKEYSNKEDSNMDEPNGAKKRGSRRGKGSTALPFETFNSQEQALITLGADKRKQSITEFMAEGVRFYLRETVEIRFKTESGG